MDGQGNLTLRWLDKITIKDVRDGTSNTVLAGEMHIPDNKLNLAPYNGPVFRGLSLSSHSRVGGPDAPLLTSKFEPQTIFGFGSVHSGITQFVYTDGSTYPLKNSLDPITLGQLCHRNDGQIIDLDR